MAIEIRGLVYCEVSRDFESRDDARRERRRMASERPHATKTIVRRTNGKRIGRVAGRWVVLQAELAR